MKVPDYDKHLRINLRTIFTKDLSELPTWMDSKDCIDVMMLDDRWTSDMTKIFIDTYELRN